MYVCVCVHAYVLTHARTHAQNTYVRMYVCMYVLMAFADKLQMLQGSKLAKKKLRKSRNVYYKDCNVLLCRYSSLHDRRAVKLRDTRSTKDINNYEAC